jgi:hypothetical protein
MTPLRPRQTLHRGSVMAAGLAIDTRIIGEPEARRRILRLPSRGLAVFRIGSSLVARFPEPVRLAAAAAAGAPLVRYGRLLSAAPLDSDEQAALAVSAGASGETAVLADGGAAVAAPLDDEARVDISEWIDVSGFGVVHDLRSLGAVQPDPRPAIPVPAGTVRESFGMAPLDREAAEMLVALTGRPAAEAARGGGTSRQSWLGRLLAGLQQLVRPPQRAAAGGVQQAGSVHQAGSPGAAAGASPRPGLLAAIRDRFARAAWSSQLGRFLGRRYAEHLARMLAMLDAQDYDNALRHAVPLSDEVASALRAPPLGLPAARANLAITPRRPAAGTALGLGGELFELLRQRYRRAFERLDARGDVEKAAFVLAELLNANEEAVSYLERHGRLKLAAEIAEARKLPPGLMIRLWFLAGDRTRAVQIARMTGAIADAVLRLEQSHREEGRILRLMWADSLASAGAYAAAVDAASPLAEARHLVRAWIDRAIAVGGPGGARMLARKVRLAPEEFAGLRDQALDLLCRDAEDGAASVRAFAQELVQEVVQHEPTAGARVLARPTVRRLLRESRDSKDAELQRLIERLLKIAEPAFAADVRAWQQSRPPSRTDAAAPPQRALESRPKPLEIDRPAGDRGGIAVTDAAVLPGGGMLAAAGELGVFLLSRDGKVSARFAEPAHAIVISDQGDRAILVAKRGETFRVSRLDLLTRRLQHWCDARFTRFAPDFDGATWFVARGDTLYAIDAMASRWTHLWKVDERGASVHAIARDARWLSALMVGPQQCEVWTYELPSITLRSRQPIAREMDGKPIGGFAAVASHGRLVGWQREPWDGPELQTGPDVGGPPFRTIVSDTGRWKRLPVAEPEAPKNVAATNGWIAAPVERTWLEMRGGQLSREWQTVIHLLDAGRLGVRAVITLDGAEQAGVRIQADRLVIFDDCGRVLAVSLSSGAVLREHRLT